MNSSVKSDVPFLVSEFCFTIHLSIFTIQFSYLYATKVSIYPVPLLFGLWIPMRRTIADSGAGGDPNLSLETGLPAGSDSGAGGRAA